MSIDRSIDTSIVAELESKMPDLLIPEADIAAYEGVRGARNVAHLTNNRLNSDSHGALLLNALIARMQSPDSPPAQTIFGPSQFPQNIEFLLRQLGVVRLPSLDEMPAGSILFIPKQTDSDYYPDTVVETLKQRQGEITCVSIHDHAYRKSNDANYLPAQHRIIHPWSESTAFIEYLVFKRLLGKNSLPPGLDMHALMKEVWLGIFFSTGLKGVAADQGIEYAIAQRSRASTSDKKDYHQLLIQEFKYCQNAFGIDFKDVMESLNHLDQVQQRTADVILERIRGSIAQREHEDSPDPYHIAYLSGKDKAAIIQEATGLSPDIEEGMQLEKIHAHYMTEAHASPTAAYYINQEPKLTRFMLIDEMADSRGEYLSFSFRALPAESPSSPHAQQLFNRIFRLMQAHGLEAGIQGNGASPVVGGKIYREQLHELMRQMGTLGPAEPLSAEIITSFIAEIAREPVSAKDSGDLLKGKELLSAHEVSVWGKKYSRDGLIQLVRERGDTFVRDLLQSHNKGFTDDDVRARVTEALLAARNDVFNAREARTYFERLLGSLSAGSDDTKFSTLLERMLAFDRLDPDRQRAIDLMADTYELYLSYPELAFDSDQAARNNPAAKRFKLDEKFSPVKGIFVPDVLFNESQTEAENVYGHLAGFDRRLEHMEAVFAYDLPKYLEKGLKPNELQMKAMVYYRLKFNESLADAFCEAVLPFEHIVQKEQNESRYAARAGRTDVFQGAVADGKSSLAREFAQIIHEHHMRVILIDSDGARFAFLAHKNLEQSMQEPEQLTRDAAIEKIKKSIHGEINTRILYPHLSLFEQYIRKLGWHVVKTTVNDPAPASQDFHKYFVEGNVDVSENMQQALPQETRDKEMAKLLLSGAFEAGSGSGQDHYVYNIFMGPGREEKIDPRVFERQLHPDPHNPLESCPEATVRIKTLREFLPEIEKYEEFGSSHPSQLVEIILSKPDGREKYPALYGLLDEIRLAYTVYSSGAVRARTRKDGTKVVRNPKTEGTAADKQLVLRERAETLFNEEFPHESAHTY